jgi:site-specific recombinase XerD
MEKLMKTRLKNSALDFTRDMFVFSCYTGLSYIDLYNLTSNQIVKEDDDFLWLNVSRQKTDSDCKIPLMDVPLKLIEKYRGKCSGDRVFPMKSCGYMNRQLKKIANRCGIKRDLTFHMSRHTFATETCLSQGVPLETLKRMMGHRRLGTTQRYAKVTVNKIDEEMKILSEKILGEYVLAS